jgi:DNA-binding winged helix-turn-helix (wHTH) protein/class 3 adenylate cyclase/predicted ATPase
VLYHFAECTLDTARYTLHRAGQDIRLSRKVFEVLRYLLAHRDRVVPKQELCDQVWEGVAISDATLESCIRAVRASVGDTGQAQQIIQTHRGYGYQCVVGVHEECASPPELLPVPPMPPVTESPPTESVRGSAAQAVSGGYPCFTCQRPNRDDATFCAACGTRLRQTCAACGQSSPIPAVFCTACGHPFVAPVLSGTLQPAATPGSPGERKPITILCCAVSLMTETGERLDVDTRHSVMQHLHDLSQDIVRRYGGRLHSVIDECFLIMFGVPVAQEDDARRAVRVALELRQHMQAHQEHYGLPAGATLTLRIGVCTGLVVTGSRRDDTEAVAPMVGDVMSHAMTLQEQAPLGGILCSTATARLLQGMVRLQDVGPLYMPGHSRPVMASLIMAEHPEHLPANLSRGRRLSPFIGREREMATLRALLTQVEAGRGQVVGVVGEAGIGKSRLVYEFRQSLQESWITYLTGRCLSYGTATPYLPVLELLRQNCNITETDRPEDMIDKVQKSLQDVQMEPETWAPVLLHLLGVPAGEQALATLSPEVRKTRTVTVLTQMCLHGSRQRPLIVEIEDLHWIDASSNEWITTLVDRIAGIPLLLLVTYRPGYRPAWIDKSYTTQISLAPLTPPESLQVVQTILPTETLPTPLVPQLLAKADGNPFFLEELAQAVAEQGGDVPATTVPDTVQAVLTARIDRLPTPAKSVLQAAAVIGKDIDLPLLQAIADVPDEALQHHLTSLQAAEFLYEAPTASTPVYMFKHALTQEVAYQSLLRRTRQQYHTRIAQALEAQFPEVVEQQPERLAQHYTGAEQAARAIPYWQQAGQRAVERSANVEAISHFTKGLELLKALPDTPERVQQELTLHLALGSPLMLLKGFTSPDVERTYAHASALAQQLGETPQHFSVLVGLWRMYFSQARLHTAREMAVQCLALAQYLQDPVALQEAHLALGSTCIHLGELYTAREHLERSIVLHEPRRSHPVAFSRGTDPGVVGLARGAWSLWLLGYAQQALMRSREALALAQRSAYPADIAFAMFFAAVLYQCRREAPQVREQAEEVIRLATEQGFTHWVAGGTLLRGWALVHQGALEEGIEQLRQGHNAWLATGNELGKTQILARLSEAYGKAGCPEEGLRVLDEAFATLQKNAERHYESDLYRLKGVLLLQQTGLQLPPMSVWREAETCFQQAVDVARQQGAKFLELRAVMRLGSLWQTHDRREQAYQALKKAYDWFAEGLDTPDLQEAKKLLETWQV